MTGSRIACDLASEVAAEDRIGFARSLAAAATAAYCRAAGVPLRPLVDAGAMPLGTSASLEAARLGARAAASGPGEAARLIGAAYAMALPGDHRALHGVFYTPPPLVEHLLDMAEGAGADLRTARVLDPACGGGAFMVAAAARMAARLAALEPALALRRIGRQLRGFELDPFGAWLAQAMIDAQLAPLALRAGRAAPVVVEQRDSLDLRACDAGRFDVVIGNPPYGRVTPPPERRAIYARSTYGHANLYGLFTDAALRWAAPGGVVAYVTPTSMLSGLYYKSLRALLRREAPPTALGLVAERAGVFDGVLQETMLAVYVRDGAEPARGRSIGFLNLDASGGVCSRPAGTFTLPPCAEAPWLLPRTPDQVALTRQLRRMPHRLSDYGYRVSTGPLVWNRHKSQLGAARGGDGYPVVWAESVTADGRFAWRTERRNHAPWLRADLPRDAWLLTHRPCVLLQRTTAKEQARRLIAAEIPADFIRRHGAVAIENHLNMVRPAVAVPCVPSSAVAAFLNSASADGAFRCINGSVAVSAYELEGMPVPPPAVMLRVADLLASGAPRLDVEDTLAAAYRGEAATRCRQDADAAA